MKQIGLLIKEVVEQQGHSVGWLTRQLSCDRSNVYRLFQRSNIDMISLERLCRILKHDFFLDLSQELREDAPPAGTVGAAGAVGVARTVHAAGRTQAVAGSGGSAQRHREHH